VDVRGGVDRGGGVGRRGAGEGGEEVRGVVGEEVEAHEEEEDGHGEADEDFGAFETVREGVGVSLDVLDIRSRRETEACL